MCEGAQIDPDTLSIRTKRSAQTKQIQIGGRRTRLLIRCYTFATHSAILDTFLSSEMILLKLEKTYKVNSKTC